MLKKEELRGVIVALVTPFTSEGELDLDASSNLVNFVIDKGVNGVAPLCGTGEPLALSIEERIQVAERVIEEVSGQVPVIIGCFGANQREVLDLASFAGNNGADALLVTPPPFVMPTIPHITRQFQEIADASGLPLIVFNAPSRVGINLEPDTLRDMKESVPQIVGIKAASGGMSALIELVETMGTDVSILQGWDDQLWPSLCSGATGGFLALANLVPDMFVQIYKAFENSDLSAGRDMQIKLLELVRVAYCEPNPVPLKVGMEMAGLPVGPNARPPLYPASKETRDKLLEVLEDLEMV